METVKVLSNTQQEFLGEVYYLCGKYFQKGGIRLHRVVWEYYNGPVPIGYCVHHKKGPYFNNPEDLELMVLQEHSRMHSVGHGRGIPKEAITSAAEWHKSEEGSEWHKKHYEENKELLHCKITRKCSNCGTECTTVRKNTNAFCSNKCKSAFRRKSGVDTISKTCAICGSIFTTDKNSGKYTKTCSKQCGYKLRIKGTICRKIRI